MKDNFMLEIYLLTAFKGIIRILLAIFIGTAIGTIFECRNGTKYLKTLTKPLLKYSNLPAICGTAFLTAFVSNIAASGMLAGAYSDKQITRRQMISGAIINSFPAYATIMLLVMFILFPMIGRIAIIYAALVILLDLIRVFVIISIIKLFSNRSKFEHIYKFEQPDPTSWNDTFKKIKKRTLKVCKRFILWGIPLYLLAILLSHTGIFNEINQYIPKIVRDIFPSGVITIIIAKLGGLTTAATVAMGMLQVSKITTSQVLLAFFAGNIFDIPLRTVKHNLPIALGIFPEKSGLWIVLISESTRMLMSILAVIMLLFYI